MQLTDGWHHNRHDGMHELWQNGEIIHKVTDEAWQDFLAWLETPTGKRAAGVEGWAEP